MESTYSSLNFYKLLNKKSCRSPSLCLCGSLSSPFGAPLCSQTSKEEGSVNQAEKFSLTDLRESLRALDDSSEIHWLNDVFTFCPDCWAFMNMGNQQVTKLKPRCYRESWDALPSSPRIHMPRKRRRREVTPPQVFLTEGRQSSSSVGANLPAARRHKVTEKEREEKRMSSEMLKPDWRVKLPDASAASLQKSLRKNPSPADSDSDLSEYDNEIYSIFNPSIDIRSITAMNERKNTKDRKFCQEAAAQRVMSKIKEVEGILRRISLTSSDWMKEDEEEGDEPSSGVSQQVLQQRCHPEFNTQSRHKSSEKDRILLVEELCGLDDGLTHSLKMEQSKSEREEQSNRLQRPLNSHLHPFTCAAEIPPAPSPTLSDSSSLDRLSPILSSPLPSSLIDVTETSESHRVWTDSGKDTMVSLEDGGCESWTRISGGAETDWGETQETLTWSTLQLKEDYLLSSDEALQKQEEIWQQEVEESLSRCRSLFHPSRPKLIDFLCITAAADDIIDTDTPLLQVRES